MKNKIKSETKIFKIFETFLLFLKLYLTITRFIHLHFKECEVNTSVNMIKI